MRRKSRNRRFAVAMLIICMVFGVVFPWGAAGGGAEAAAGVALRSDGADAPGEWVIGLSEAVQGETERERLAVDLAAHGIVLLDADERMWLVRGGGQQIHRLQSAYPDLMIQPNLTYELRVDDVEPFRMTAIGADRLAGLQWGLDAIRATKAWELLLGRELKEVVVAVVDSGVDLSHPDLVEQIAVELGYNAFDREAPPEDDNGHGTHVAGVIAATVGNGEGVRGVAGFPAVKIMPVKVMDEKGKGSTYEIARGIDYAVDQGADVINLSIGGPDEDPFIRESVKRAVRKGIPVVVAAGNDGQPAKNSTPANVPEALTVGAMKRDRQWLPESNYGPEVDLAAPGEQILSTYRQDVIDYAYMTGTSAAAPFVSGVVALMKAIKPDLSVDAVRLYLTGHAERLGTVDEKGRNDRFGYGLVRADQALAALLQHVDSGAALPGTSPEPGTPGSSYGAGTPAVVPVPFRDVSDHHWAAASIQYAVGKKWFGGFPDGTFKPGQPMKRAQTAAVFTTLLDLPLAVPRFHDIYSDHWAAYQIGAVQERGIMTGDRGYFRPNAPLTRAQFAKVLVQAFGLSAPPNGFSAAQVFPDVRPDDWYAPYADIVAGLGLMRGNEEGKFLPNRPITRAEVAVILHRYDLQQNR